MNMVLSEIRDRLRYHLYKFCTSYHHLGGYLQLELACAMTKVKNATCCIEL